MQRASLSVLSVLLLLSCVLATGCACDGNARNDALLLLSRYEDVDLEAPADARREAIHRLQNLPIASDEVRVVRDACGGAYGGVLSAEEHHAQAVQMFLTASNNGAREVDNAQKQRIDQEIAASDRALERARNLTRECDRLVRGLRVKYQPQRRHD